MGLDDEVATMIWWPSSAMKAEIVEDALDYLFFMQEVTNAYSTELIWALALALGLTCLYIWRALGLQEAARMHSHMVTSRPVFSAVPLISAAVPSCSLLSNYKNRYAHRGRGEERMSTVGYDVLHTYNQRYCPRRIVPRAVWKRHSTRGQEDNRFPANSKDVLFNVDSASSPSSRYHSELSIHRSLGSGIFCGTSPLSAHRTRGKDNVESKDTKAATCCPYLYTQTLRQQQHFHRQQMQKLHQQLKQHIPRGNERSPEVKPRSSLPHNVSPISPNFQRPIPAPRDEKKISQTTKPFKDSSLSQHPDGLTGQQGAASNEGPTGEMKETNEAGTGGVGAGMVMSHKDKDHCPSVDALSDSVDQNTEMSASSAGLPAESISGEQKTIDDCQSNKNNKRENGFRENYIYQTRTSSQSSMGQERKANAQCEALSLRKDSRPMSGRSDEEAARLLRQRLLNQDDIFSRYKSASNFLEKFAQSYLNDQRQRAEGMSSYHQIKPENMEFSYLKSKRSPYLARKTTETRLSRKRSKTVQKGESKSKITEDTMITAKENDKVIMYNSAVLQAVKADEKNQKIDTPPSISLEHVCSSSMDTNDSESNQRHRNAADDTEYERKTMYEAGKRLAKLRKRLEESLEQIQNQPGLGKEVLEKARTANMRKQRDELENVIFAKGDVPVSQSSESKSVCLAGRSQGRSAHHPQCDGESAREYQHVPKVAPVQTSEVSDGEPNHSSTHTTRNSEVCHDTGNTSKRSGTEGNNARNVFSDAAAKEKIQHLSRHLKGNNQTEIEKASDEEKHYDHPTKIHTQSCQQDMNVSAPSGTTKSSEREKGTEHQNSYNNCFPGETELYHNVKSDNPRILTSSKRTLDEQSLAVILERQSKRREDLKQRKRSPIKVTIEAESGNSTVPVEKQPQDGRTEQLSCLKSTHKNQVADHPSEDSKHPFNTPGTKDDCCEWVKINDASPVITDGSPFHETSGSKLTLSETRNDAANEYVTRDKQNEECSQLETGPYPTKRCLGHQEDGELSIQENNAEGNLEESTSEKSHGLTDGELAIGGERESSFRRRVRWRRQAERAEKQRKEAAECQKTPPPVPPKVTRLNATLSLNDESHQQQDFNSISINANLENRCVSEGESKPESVVKEDSCIYSSEKPEGIENSFHKLVPSPKLVRGSFICTIRDKNTVLAAGEMGLVKGPPDNVEICEEKALTPRKAASVFDPKVQLEREKERQEAERAVKASDREGMASPLFRANVRRFEQGVDPSADTSIIVESKVKANVKMFEEGLRGHTREVSVSPEKQRSSRRKSRSPSLSKLKPNTLSSKN